MVTILLLLKHIQRLNTDFGRIHDDSRNKVEEDVVAVGADTCVAEGHLQFIHGLQEESFSLILKVLKGGFLGFKNRSSFSQNY